MGGFGSGQWVRQTRKPVTSDVRSIDSRLSSRLGRLRHGSVFDVGRFRARVDTNQLSFYLQDFLIHRVLLVPTPCTFGGQRIWFICPNERCRRRSACIYFKDDTIGCRSCFGLGYASQRNRAPARNLDKARSLRRRLTATEDITQPLPPRPAGMHSKTYAALLAQAIQIEATLVCPQLRAAQESFGTERFGMPDIAECHFAGGALKSDAERLCRMLWRIAQLPPECTKGSVLAQLRAIDAIARLKGFID
jgi:hypothetical protein